MSSQREDYSRSGNLISILDHLVTKPIESTRTCKVHSVRLVEVLFRVWNINKMPFKYRSSRPLEVWTNRCKWIGPLSIFCD